MNSSRPPGEGAAPSSRKQTKQTDECESWAAVVGHHRALEVISANGWKRTGRFAAFAGAGALFVLQFVQIISTGSTRTSATIIAMILASATLVVGVPATVRWRVLLHRISQDIAHALSSSGRACPNGPPLTTVTRFKTWCIDNNLSAHEIAGLSEIL